MRSPAESRIKSSMPDLSRLSFLLLLIGALASILWSMAFSIVTITIPYQIELREGAAQVVTRLLLSRENPYTFEHQPLAMNIYGLGYNLAVLPFAAWFGNSLAVHRSMTFAFIVLAALITASAVFQTRRDVSAALICAAFVMIGLIGHAGIGAFSSAMGGFLFLAAVLIPYLHSFSARSLTTSMVLTLVAFYTKAYFVLAFGVVASYVFLFESKKKAVQYGLTFLLLFMLLFLIVRPLFPLYFFDVFIVNMSMSWLSYPHMWSQLSSLFQSFLPILSLTVVLLLTRHAQAGTPRAKVERRQFPGISIEWRLPLIRYSFDFPLYFFACTLTVFAFILGRHMGNSMNYAYQLLVPSFICWFAIRITPGRNFSLLFSVLVLYNLFSWQAGLLSPRLLEQRDSKEWERFFTYVRSSSNILNSQLEASEVSRLGLTPMDTGQTIVYYQVKPFEDSFLTPVSYDAVVADGVKYTVFIDQSIAKQKFDLVVTVKEKGVFYHVKWMEKYYEVVDEIRLDMPQASQQWTALIWKPKSP